LEDVIHSDDERVVDLQENQFLYLQRVDGVVFDNDVFADTLHGVKASVALALDEVNFAERASADTLNHLEVVEGRCH